MTEPPEDDFERARMILVRRRELGESFDVAWARVFAALPPSTATKMERRRDL